MLKIKLLKVATPLTAATEMVLVGANAPGPLLTATVMTDVLDVITLPNWSCTAICSEVAKALPAVPEVGVLMMAS